MNICICGIGKAGKAIAQKLLDTKKHCLCLVLTRDGSADACKDLGQVLGTAFLDIPVVSIENCEETLLGKKIDIIIDFSNHTASISLLKISEKASAKLVICTTNHPEDTLREIRDFTIEKKLGVVYAPNLTLGVNLLMDFVSTLSKMLDTDFDFEIIERHNKNKSRITTTAKIISQKINRGDINISSVRVGGYVGVHEVTCANENERITIVHESFTRQAFANGAMMAVDFIQEKRGFYLMDDVVDALKKNNGIV